MHIPCRTAAAEHVPALRSLRGMPNLASSSALCSVSCWITASFCMTVACRSATCLARILRRSRSSSAMASARNPASPGSSASCPPALAVFLALPAPPAGGEATASMFRNMDFEGHGGHCQAGVDKTASNYATQRAVCILPLSEKHGQSLPAGAPAAAEASRSLSTASTARSASVSCVITFSVQRAYSVSLMFRFSTAGKSDHTRQCSNALWWLFQLLCWTTGPRRHPAS